MKDPTESLWYFLFFSLTLSPIFVVSARILVSFSDRDSEYNGLLLAGSISLFYLDFPIYFCLIILYFLTIIFVMFILFFLFIFSVFSTFRPKNEMYFKYYCTHRCTKI